MRLDPTLTGDPLADSLIADGSGVNFRICATAATDEAAGTEKTKAKADTDDGDGDEDEDKKAKAKAKAKAKDGEEQIEDDGDEDEEKASGDGMKEKCTKVDENQPTYASAHKLTLEGTARIDLEAEQTLSSQGGEGFTKPKLAGFTMTANSGSAMKLAGWRYPVVLDLEGLSIPRQNSPIRMNHDSRQGVGHTTEIKLKGGKLLASGVISRDTEAAREVKASAGNGFPWQASVGASADDVEFVREGQKGAANGREYDGPVNIARRSTLGEISFVDSGADPHTEALVASNRIAAIKDGGETDDDGKPIDGKAAVQQIIGRTKQERLRQEAISALVEEACTVRGANEDQINKIAAKAFDEGWTVQKTELEFLRISRPSAPQYRKADVPHPKVLEASLCLACGVKDTDLAKDRDYGEDVVMKAYPLRNQGLVGTIRAALEASGVNVPHGSRELYTTILETQQNRGIAAAGFSTVNLPGVLGNVANKILIQAFLAVAATYDRIADQADFSNFHIHSIYRLEQTGDFALVKPDGEIRHGALEQDSYTNKLDTYGRMLTLNRQDIINDDLNAFQSLTAQLARRARIAVEKALYALVSEASDVFYTVARGNRFTSSSLNIATIAQAEAAQFNMTDLNGDPIYAQSRFLVVPPALKYLGEQIYSSQLVNDFTTGTARPTDNPFRGRYEPISSPYLQNASIAGNSSTTWYLLADPLMLPAFQVAYLDGRRAPTIESADALFNVLGLQLRAYWDFGVSALDYRGAVKSTA